MIFTLIAGVLLGLLMFIRTRIKKQLIRNPTTKKILLASGLFLMIGGLTGIIVLIFAGFRLTEMDLCLGGFILGIAMTGFVYEISKPHPDQQ